MEAKVWDLRWLGRLGLGIGFNRFYPHPKKPKKEQETQVLAGIFIPVIGRYIAMWLIYHPIPVQNEKRETRKNGLMSRLQKKTHIPAGLLVYWPVFKILQIITIMFKT